MISILQILAYKIWIIEGHLKKVTANQVVFDILENSEENTMKVNILNAPNKKEIPKICLLWDVLYKRSDELALCHLVETKPVISIESMSN